MSNEARPGWIFYTFKVKLNPTPEQVELFKIHAGMRRFIYNGALKANIDQYNYNKKFINNNALKNQLPDIKLKPEFAWLNQCESSSIQQAVNDFYTALDNFKKSKQKIRKGRKMGFPKFKKKGKSRDSFRILNNNRNLDVDKRTGSITVPKIGIVKTFDGKQKFSKIPKIVNYRFQHYVKNITISRDSDNCWYASVLTEIKHDNKIVKRYQSTGKTCGIDVGIRTSYTLYDCSGNTITGNMPAKLFTLELKLKKYQAEYDRKLKAAKKRAKLANKSLKDISTKNLAKAKTKLSKVHYRIKEIRKNFLHQESHKIARDYDIVTMETLDIQSMMKKKHLAKSIGEQGWYMFKTFIRYKLAWNNKTLIEVEKWFPSSKLCSVCHTQNNQLGSELTWECPTCNTHHSNRDINAAMILNKISNHCLNTGESVTTLTKFNAVI